MQTINVHLYELSQSEGTHVTSQELKTLPALQKAP